MVVVFIILDWIFYFALMTATTCSMFSSGTSHRGLELAISINLIAFYHECPLHISRHLVECGGMDPNHSQTSTSST